MRAARRAARLGCARRRVTASGVAVAGGSFWARRARFQALRAAAECLRARLASRLASFRRLRARLSSSLAMRTRCFATSACSRARSRGSAGASCPLPVFFICDAQSERTSVSHKAPCVATVSHLSTEFVHKYVDRCGSRVQTPSSGKGLHHRVRVFARRSADSSASSGRRARALRARAHLLRRRCLCHRDRHRRSRRRTSWP